MRLCEKLCPAKLEGRDKGNLISIITTDIELLEVFYAHTISPIAIATLTSVIMVIFIGRYHVLAGVLALASYLIVGVVIPMWNGKRGSQKGMEFRTEFGELNSFVLDSLRGMDETIQYDQGKKRKGQMSDRSRKLAGMQGGLKLDGRFPEIIYKSDDPGCFFRNAGVDDLSLWKRGDWF